MLINIILLVVGFILLIKGADFFVDGASGIAEHFRVSKMLIALTIVSFGTSAPELAVSIKSLLSGNGDIVLGNVIGSNILNILLILGVSSLVHPLTVKNNTVKKELPITLMITLAFSVLLLDTFFNGETVSFFTRSDGIILLLFFSVFLYYLFSLMKNKVDKDDDKATLGLSKAIVFTIIGLLGIVFGSNFVVDSAAYIAKALGVTQRIISLTIVALGTSLPELVTSVMATKKGEYDIAIGNVVGSNIFNIGVVIGIPVALLGGVGVVTFSYLDIIVMIMAALMLFLFSINDYKISKREGIMFLILFIVYYSYVVL